MKQLIIIFLTCISASVFSQYTHADSLKGGSRPQRDVFDVYYYDINLDVDVKKQFIKGEVSIYFGVTLGGKIDRMQIDLYKNLKIITIKDSEGKDLTYQRDENAVFINVNETMLNSGKITVFYEGNPTVSKDAPWQPGFVFKKDNKNRPWVSVACQGSGASIWWPCKDTQADEADSVRISITTQHDLKVISNGNLRLETQPLDGVRTTEWFVSYPINNYDVSINIGNYVNFNEKYKGIEATYDLDYYVLDYNLEKAKLHFKQVVPMMNAFEKKLGPYPFPRDGFALIETPYLGMEHQSGIAYGNRYLKGYEGVERSGIDLGFDFIIVHETGHEYWGNSITTKDVADMWVHEGFCTYSEALYVEEVFGADTALMYCNAWKLLVQNDAPIVGPYGVHKEGSVDMYNKGALMLHTLRWQVNDDKKWYPLIKNILKDFRSTIITGDQLIQYINQQLGKDYTFLFEHYLKNAEPPYLHYDLTEKGNDLEVNIYFLNVKSDFKLDLLIKTGQNKCKTYTVTNKPQKIVLKNIKKTDFQVDESHAYFLIR
jgi:aminopeptidase N